MKTYRSLVCIVCPVGCNVEVCMDGDGIESVDGNTCRRGADYAEAECTNPTRILTTTAMVLNGQLPVVPVKSDRPLPKGLIMKCMEEINSLRLIAPVGIGDVVIGNILDTRVNIVATGNIKERGHASTGSSSLWSEECSPITDKGDVKRCVKGTLSHWTREPPAQGL